MVSWQLAIKKMKVCHIKKKREKKEKGESGNTFARRLPFELRRFPRIAGALQRAINDKSPFDVKAYRLPPPSLYVQISFVRQKDQKG